MAVSEEIDSQVLEAIRTHTRAQNDSSFLTLNRGTDTFTVPGVEGVISYRRTGGYLVQFGGPFAPVETYDELLDAFTAFADKEGLTPVGVQLQEFDAKKYAERGFTVNQVGASFSVDLDTFSLRGTRFMQLRNKISRSFRAGLHVEEADPERCGDALKEIDTAWLGTKGAHELEFLIGQIGGPAQEHRRLFIGRIEGRPIGYISYSPVYGGRPGWMHDLSRRLPGGPPGVMEAINVTAIERFTKENTAWLHFGFTPFTGLEERHELPGHSPGFTRLMHFLWENGEAVYPARSQLAYKEKWAPDVIRPQYAAFRGAASVAGFAHVFRACGAF